MNETQKIGPQLAGLGQPSPYSETAANTPVTRAEFDKFKRDVLGAIDRLSLSTSVVVRACGKDVEDKFFDLMDVVYSVYRPDDSSRTSETALAAVLAASE